MTSATSRFGVSFNNPPPVVVVSPQRPLGQRADQEAEQRAVERRLRLVLRPGEAPEPRPESSALHAAANASCLRHQPARDTPIHVRRAKAAGRTGRARARCNRNGSPPPVNQLD